MEASTYIVDPSGTADFVRIEDAVAASKAGTIIRLAAAEFSWRGRLDITKGCILSPLIQNLTGLDYLVKMFLHSKEHKHSYRLFVNF